MLTRSMFALVLPGLLAACVGGHATRDSELSGAAGAPSIVVTNHHAQDMKIYILAIPGESRRRLGTVTAKTTATFVAPRQYWNRPVRILLQPFAGAGEEFATEEFIAEAGRLVDVRVDVVLTKSVVYVR